MTQTSGRTNIKRRDFLKGAALGTIAVGGVAGLFGCAPSGETGGAGASEEGRQFPGIVDAQDFADSETVVDPITDFAEEETYDLVVCGAGMAGVPAVLTSLDEGASVCCLQKLDAAAGNGNGSGAIILEESDPQALFEWMQAMRKMNNYRVNWELLEFFARHSGETLCWLDKKYLEIDYLPDIYTTSFSETYDSGNHLAYARHSFRSHTSMLRALSEYAEKNGAVFHYKTPAVQLIVESGAVKGVFGRKEDGSYLKINAEKGVVLATGDYQCNDSMKNKYLPELLHIQAFQAERTGDGHLMAVLAGGRMVPPPHTKQVHDVYSTTFGISATPMLALDHHGKRFMNENTVMPMWFNNTRYFYDQEDRGTFFRFFDDAFDTKYTTFPAREEMEKYIVGQEIDPAETSQIPYQPTMIGCHRANTVAELAEQMGLDAAAVQKSIDEWNEYCSAGEDPVFGLAPEHLKPIDTPPYWGISNHVRCIAINSGVVVDGNYQVLDEGNQPIPGLFAAGTCAGDMDGAPDWQMSNSTSNGHCSTAGRYAAIRALTGSDVPKNPASWDEVKDLYADIKVDSTWQKK